MGFRFHKAFRLGKLVRLNVGKKSASVGVGVPGFRVNVGSQGSRATFGVPGTGLSYSTRLGASSAANSSSTKSGCSGCLTLVMLAVLGFWSFAFVVGLIQIWINPGEDHTAAVSVQVFFLLMMAGTVAFWILLVKNKQRAIAAEQERQAFEAAEQHRQWEAERQVRWSQLVDQFGQSTAEQIWRQTLWVGAPVAVVQAMFGPPLDIDEKVMKTKTKYTYKYKATGVNRYALRVFIEDGEVTGWEDKS